ncbi:cystathionine beta-lyase [Dysgonomonadaceae bacterium PH5-43]|nr:cystathionine beta-lyase [Dysgonomonadaceae bacterium PH5-43]
MKNYSFDKIINREGTDALKLESLQELYGDTNLLPLWIADMDFETPPFITEALQQRLNHSLFGYTVEPKDYWPTVIDWIASHHQWNVKREWLTYIPGIVRGIGMAINVFVKEDEKVIIQPPVYNPFQLTTLGNKREVVYNPLRKNKDGSYSIDFENLEAVTDDKCRMLIFANPHNPAGITWDKETLVRLADFCYKRNIIVISDEIHCDMALWDNKHIPFATVSDEAAACSITFSAPSKTFNIAGIVSSYAVVPDDNIRKRYFDWLTVNEFSHPNMFAPIATIAAFSKGEPWRKEMLRYIENNIDFLIDYCEKYIPQIKPLRPQASFLVWLDCRSLNLNHDQLIELFVKKARLALNDGEMYGQGGEGFMRINVGVARSILEQALEQLRKALT